VLRAQGADWRHIIDLYQLRRVRFSAAYIAPLVLALAVLIQQIVSGHAGAGITEFVRAVPSALPPGSH
jgi:hypothetical protein